MGVNSLPKTVTRQRRDCNLNQSASAPESSTLTTRLPSHSTVIKTNTQYTRSICCTHTHNRLMALCPGLPEGAGTRKVKTNLDFTEARQ